MFVVLKSTIVIDTEITNVISKRQYITVNVIS